MVLALYNAATARARARLEGARPAGGAPEALAAEGTARDALAGGAAAGRRVVGHAHRDVAAHGPTEDPRGASVVSLGPIAEGLAVGGRPAVGEAQAGEGVA